MTIEIYSIFDTTSGEILRNVVIDSALIGDQLQAGEDYLTGEYSPEDYYVSDPGGSPAAAAKSTLTPTWTQTTIDGDDSDAATIASGIPNPTDYRLDTRDLVGYDDTAGYSGTITDGSFTYTTKGGGKLIVYLDAGITYKLYSQEITVNFV